MKRSFINLMLYLLLILTLVLIIGVFKKDSKNLDPEVTYSIGDKAVLSDSQWELLDAKDLGRRLHSYCIFFDDKVTEGKFIEIQFKVTNTSMKELQFNLFIDRHHPILYDSKNREFKYIDSMSIYLPDSINTTNSLDSDTKIQAGLSQTFSAIYEVPKDAYAFIVVFKSLNNSTINGISFSLGF